ncbi:MAG: hypothetical protein H7068_00020 [Pedobacter sp.]|nr:hypothetical protein [Chitinophagaceae bacterium]
MKKIILIFFFSAYYCHTTAQGFYIDLPKKPDDFTVNFLSIMNDAGANFSHLKGKAVITKDTIHLASKIFQTKIKLPGSTNGRLVTDSTIYMEYFFGDFATIEDASDAYNKLNNKVSKAIYKRTFIKDFHLDTNGTVVRLQKMAYCINRGFYHYNMSMQIIRLLHNGKFRLMLQIYNGKPQFYYRIVRNEPIGSFIMINSLKTNLSSIQNENSSGCPENVPPFRCLGKNVKNDSTFVTYQKSGFDDYPNARTEFDVYMSNLRVSLGCEYVFYSLPCPAKGPVFKRWAFVNINDLENYKRKTVLLSLLELPNPTLNERGFNREYAIQLDFTY